MIDFKIYAYFCDYCIFITQHVRRDWNKSEDIFLALNSTKLDKVGKFDKTQQDIWGVKNLLEILDSKLNERFV